MDVKDVSELPQFGQMLLRQKKDLQDAQRRKGQRPTTRTPRDAVLGQFLTRLMMGQGRVRNNDGHQLRTSFVPPAYPPCIAPLSKLEKIMMKDLLLETNTEGKFLLVRSITPADRMTAIMSIMEDETRDCLLVQLYYQDDEIERKAKDILQEGDVLIIKQPFFKRMSDGEYGIRVDHLSDVVRLQVNNEQIPTPWRSRSVPSGLGVADWKAKGNDHFKRSDFHAAIECYTRALDCSASEDEAFILKLNRSLTFIRVARFDDALMDLDYDPITVKSNEKQLFRTAQALYSLQRFREAHVVLEALCTNFPTNQQAKDDLSRTLRRLEEETTGEYSFSELYAESASLRPPQLDHATYIGPVAVKSSNLGGRGLFTTAAVKAGDLLLCEKAFAYAFAYNDKGQMTQGVTVLIDPHANGVTMGTQPELTKMIIHKLHRNPSLCSIVTDLHHGSYKPVSVSEVDGVPIIDTFLISRIVSLNCFGCPTSSRESRMRRFEPGKRRDVEETFHSCGLWPLASYINHSCDSTARRSFIGDMMFVHATRDLPPDTEITHWYQPPHMTIAYDKRQEKLRHWGFVCNCAICQDDRASGKSTFLERERLRKDIQSILHSSGMTRIGTVQSAIATIARSYRRPATEVPRLSLWQPLMFLADAYMLHEQPTKAVHLLLEALQSLGYVIEGGRLPHKSGSPIVIKKWGLMNDNMIDCWVCLANAYSPVAPDLEMQAYQFARLSYKICVGEDESFDDAYTQ